MAGDERAAHVAAAAADLPVMNEAQGQLWERMDKTLFAHFDYLKKLRKPDIEDIQVFASMVELHSYLQNSHVFQVGEVERLLKFDNPLAVVSDAWELNGGVTENFDINRLLDELDAEATHPLWHDPDAGLARLPELLEKLDTEIARLKIDWLAQDAEMLIDVAAEINAATGCHDHFRHHHEYDGDIVEHLLKFQQPLALLISHWPNSIDLDYELGHFMENLRQFAESDLHYYAVVEDVADAPPERKPEAPASLHDRLKANQQEISQRPPAGQGPNGGPEL